MNWIHGIQRAIDYIEKGVLYGVGLDGRGEASHNIEYMEKAYNMGYNC